MKSEREEATGKIIMENSVLIDKDGISSLYASVLKMAGFGLGSILYAAGKKAGNKSAMSLKEHLKIEGMDLIEAMVYSFKVGNWGEMEMGNCEEKEGYKIEVTKDVLLEGLERKKKPVCYPLAGYIAGFFELALGKKVQVKEEACIAKGDPACIFHVKVK